MSLAGILIEGQVLEQDLQSLLPCAGRGVHCYRQLLNLLQWLTYISSHDCD